VRGGPMCTNPGATPGACAGPGLRPGRARWISSWFSRWSPRSRVAVVLLAALASGPGTRAFALDAPPREAAARSAETSVVDAKTIAGGRFEVATLAVVIDDGVAGDL